MLPQRWLRIIPVALVMYTISYVDRTNVTLALDPQISSMMRDLGMNDEMKGQAMAVFFLGYVVLQAVGGHLAGKWSAKKLVSLCLVFWGMCAVACGLVKTFTQFEVARFFLGVSESCVFPATVVLLAHWFPYAERARANAFWNLCQPLAVAAAAPITGLLLGAYGWQTMLILEGALPFVWLPIWWFFIADHPREARWLPPSERNHVEAVLRSEAEQLDPARSVPLWRQLLKPTILIMMVINILHNAEAYGCMTFFTDGLKARHFSPFQHGILLAIPYVITAVVMVVNSWHSDKTRERRGHVAVVYILSGSCLILSVMTREHFWTSYGFLCLAIPGPFAALAPFWAIPAETMPRAVFGAAIGLVNSVGNLVGGYFGPRVTGWLKDEYHSVSVPFTILGIGLLVAASLAFLLPGSALKSEPPAATSL